MSNVSLDKNVSANPYAAGEVALQPQPQQAELADLGSRFLAVLIDSVLWSAPFFFLLLSVGVAILPLIWGDQRGVPLAMASSGVALLCIIALPVLMLVQLYMMAKHSATIGKKIMGIKVIYFANGTDCGLARYFWLRGGISWLLNLFTGGLYFFVDTAFILSDNRRCLHDLIAETTVVKA